MATLPLSPDGTPLPRWLIATLALFALVALTVPYFIVRNAPTITPAATQVVRPQRIVPKAELPPVEPIAFQNLTPTDARGFNATIPFSTAPNPAARPFSIFGVAESQVRAVDCLAAAVLYEAGDDPVGQRAVAQVVLNRVRHPAYPNTVCGVVFQGSERRTGCQFTFTCDGAMLRAVQPAAWARAQDIARTALNGRVDKAVGHATHYHTDWVVPYWSSSLDKIVEVNTHLFFRWTGWWGTPAAFSNRYSGVEPGIAQMARLSAAHRTAETDAALASLDMGPLAPAVISTLGGAEAAQAAHDSGTFLVTLKPSHGADILPALAQASCGDRPYCKFMAWTDKAATPAALPVTPVQQRAMSFSYLRDRSMGFEKALWNCAEFKRPEPGQCMKAQLLAPAPAVAPVAVAKPAGPEPLAGVRRKGETPPSAAPEPAATPKAVAPVRIVPTIPTAKEP